MIKLLVTGLLIYFAYKLMFRPSLSQGNREKPQQEGDIEIHHPGKNPIEDRGEFIDYEEVE